MSSNVSCNATTHLRYQINTKDFTIVLKKYKEKLKYKSFIRESTSSM